ncbi:MAG: tpn50 [Bacteroidetes bacterium]|nr:MAG: tpn50 [Bacteroidota bacterium]
MYKLITAVCFAAIVNPAWSQTEPIPGNYKDNFTQGNFLMLEENYGMALKFFREAYRTDSSSANINYKVGVCLLKSTTEKRKSLAYLRRAAQNVSRNYDEFEPSIKKAPENAFYYLAQSYHLNSQFDSAQTMFESYKTLLGTKNPDLLREVNHRINICQNAKEFTSSPMNIKITNLGDSINSFEPDYSPVVSLDENIIYFTSRRYGERGIEGLYPEDIYVSYRKPDNTWTTAVPLLGVNTIENEATISLSTDGQVLFIYKQENGGDIYFSTLDAMNNWTTPMPMEGDMNSKDWETHACLSADGNTLYFSSDRKGGLGGRDIYRCVKIGGTRWSKAINLGPTINTPFDEDAPFIHPDKTTLFFASSGHKTMGGFDIFFTAQDDSGHWAEPINMGYPINTPDDDIFYTTTVDGKRAYFSSAREGSLGDKDMYMAVLEKPSGEPENLALLRGRIFNADGTPLTQQVQINVYNNATGELVGNYRPNPKTGTYAILLEPGGSYKLVYLVNGVEYYTEIIDVPSDASYATFEKAYDVNDLMLGRIKTAPPDSIKNAKGDFINIEGRVMDKEDPTKIWPNSVVVTLKNDKGEILAITSTMKGVFRFKNVPAGTSHLIQVDELNTKAARFTTIDVSNAKTNEGILTVKVAAPSKKEDRFKVTSTGKFITVRLLLPQPEVYDPENPPPSDSAKQALTTVAGLKFMMYFKYNISEIQADDPDFAAFCDTLAAVIRRDGSIKLKLDATASQVPTRKFPTNKALAQDRAEKCKTNVMNALRVRGIDESRVTWVKVGYFVLGPTYRSDFKTNQKTYEKYQYVKIRGYSKRN